MKSFKLRAVLVSMVAGAAALAGTSSRAAELRVPGQYTTIQAAVDAAQDGDTVLIADGTYTGTGNRDIVIQNKPNLTVKSENGPATTVLDIQGSPAAQHRGFYIQHGPVTIEGLTVKNGYTLLSTRGPGIWFTIAGSSTAGGGFTVRNCVFDSNTNSYPSGGALGGAIHVEPMFYGEYAPLSFLIEESIFSNNSATGPYASRGGAIYFNFYASWTPSITIRNNEFLSNSTGYQGGAIAISNFHDSLLSITGNLFKNNSANLNSEGGALYLYKGQLQSLCEVNNNRFDGNSASKGGALYLFFGSHKVFNNRFQGNSASEGGGLYCHGSGDLKNNVFLSNTSNVGGGCFLNNQTQSSVANCTFTKNSPSAIANGLYGLDLPVANSILWDDLGTEVEQIGSGGFQISYSDVQGGVAGLGNIDADPVFVDSLGGDLRLQSGSPCTDAADGDVAPLTDIDGLPRFDDPDVPNTGVGTPNYVDVGAHERFTLPTAPAGVKAVRGSQGGVPHVDVGWNANPAYQQVIGYRIYRASGSPTNQYTLVGEVGGAALSLRDSGVPSGRLYYKVSALNSAGEGPPSAPVLAVTPIKTTVVPTVVTQ